MTISKISIPRKYIKHREGVVINPNNFEPVICFYVHKEFTNYIKEKFNILDICAEIKWLNDNHSNLEIDIREFNWDLTENDPITTDYFNSTKVLDIYRPEFYIIVQDKMPEIQKDKELSSSLVIRKTSSCHIPHKWMKIISSSKDNIISENTITYDNVPIVESISLTNLLEIKNLIEKHLDLLKDNNLIDISDAQAYIDKDRIVQNIKEK